MSEEIKLTPELLIKLGFYQLPHFTIQDSWMKKLGRCRFVSIACLGTPNEMVFITEEDAPDVKNVIVARNFDYDGYTYLHHIEKLYTAFTGELLNPKPEPVNVVDGEIRHQLQYDMHSAKVSWCPICNAHFYNERNREHTTIATQEHYHTIPASVKPVEGVLSEIFNDKAIYELPKIKQSEFNERATKVFENIAKSYNQSWHSIQLKDEEFPDESICNKCTGCGNFINGDFQADCFQDKEQGWCYYRFLDAEEFGTEVETELENIYGLIGIEITDPSPVNPSLQSGVEDAAKKHALKVWEGQKPNGYIAESIIDFKAGAEWQAQQVKQPVVQSDLEAAGIVAVNISETVMPKLTAQEQALFVAIFKECIKWHNQTKQ